MRRALLVLSGVCLSVAVLHVGITLRYPRGTAGQPGPGLYPLLLGILLAVGSLGTALEAREQRSEGAEILWPQGPSRWRTLVMLLATLGYVILLPYLGHPITGTLLLLAVFRVMGMARWLLCAVLAAVMAFGSHYLFKNLLGVPLPVGIWFG